MRAALIATGNEIVSGQIVNTNASELANLLSSEGVEVFYHLAVLDKAEDLQEMLVFLKNKKIDHVFTIGGLGPTRDDLTRKIIAEHFKKDFVFKPELWVRLEKLLKERNITPREGHKWQCYFPEGSEVLRNDKGTAHGFKTSDNCFSIWCLPGPPEEMRSVYLNGILPWVHQNIRAQTQMLTWQCVGVPESELSHQIEKALKGCDYEIGFRASPPIVELKIWTPQNDPHQSRWVKRVEKVVAPYLYSRNGQNYLKEFLDEALKRYKEFSILDQFSEGYLLTEILKVNQGALPPGLSYAVGDFSRSNASVEILKNESSVELKMCFGKDVFETSLPFHSERLKKSRRLRRHLVAHLIKIQYEWLMRVN